MKSYKSSNLRNVAVIGHGKTGKTSLLDACLFNAGAVKRLGSVEEHTSVLDCEPEEESRGMTINLKLAACEWRDYKINFIDKPGYPDFVGEVKDALTAADSALIVISAPSGIEVETEKAWRYAEEAELPRAFFINKMDREHADFRQVVEELRVRFGDGVVPVQLPIGQEAAFQGVVDLLALHMKIVTHDEEDLIADIPEYIKGDVEEARQKLIESVAEFNNELLEKYIEGTEITERKQSAAWPLWLTYWVMHVKARFLSFSVRSVFSVVKQNFTAALAYPAMSPAATGRTRLAHRRADRKSVV